KWTEEADEVFLLARRHVDARARVSCETRLAHLVGPAIREAAKELHASLILVGWRERSHLRNLVRGTLRPALHQPGCDVAFLRLDDAGWEGEPGAFHRDAAPGLRLAIATALARPSTFVVCDVRAPRTKAREADVRRAWAQDTLRAGAPDVPQTVTVEHGQREVDDVVADVGRARLVVIAAHEGEPVLVVVRDA
ncbi:MAG TPA: hypothetical protein VM370_07540, partial [Candidatus Thermoplasmatota archaeon]|nr:hypothetical protein [Candidatus Thermoplasmatota archaeon]